MLPLGFPAGWWGGTVQPDYGACLIFEFGRQKPDRSNGSLFVRIFYRDSWR